MTDRFTSMSILLAVVDAGSLSAAARRLGMPIATVSRRVSELENSIGTQILHRSARSLRVTDQGMAYIAACRRILEDLAEAEREAAGEFSAPKGLLVLTAPVVFGRLHVLPALTDFLAATPQVTARLDLTDRPISLQEEHVDAAIRIGELPDSSLRSRRLGEVRRVVCASPGYLASHGRPDHPDQLSDHDCIASWHQMPADSWSFGAGRETLSVTIRPRLTVNTAEAAIDAAAAGLGITRVLSYQVAAALRARRLEILLGEHEPAPWPVHIVYRGRAIPQKLRSFIDFAAPRIQAALA
ncbi:LysR family transcriptional regulator [Rhizobium halophytocola]|uniref:DNA-binding transcriptional LysR family regulator n=1 Tax=Rhizobium halophytocola TaxID=735519 RepID=A0ABS4E0E0_9HYPH|nr:LysR family transcriptional regulator [Rhizobium halophytocola]MBP1851398.1 DNA-binding transcriptional LysR family regulator [Rhizobium halophytocola]